MGNLIPMRMAGWCAGLLLAVSLAGCSYERDLGKGERLEREGRYQEALPLYDQAVPKISAQDGPRRSDGLVHLGRVLVRLQRFPEAVLAFQRAVDSDRRNLEAKQRLAELFASAGMFERAGSLGEQILQQRPGDPDALALLGSCAAGKQDYHHAIELYRAVLKRDPGRSTVAIALAEILADQEHPEEARQVLKTTAASSADDPSAWIALGRLEEQDGKPDAAEPAYRTAVKVRDSALTNGRLAEFLARNGRVLEAESVLRHVDALDRTQNTHRAADFMAHTGRLKDAMQQYLSRLNGKVPADRERGRLSARMVEAALRDPTTGPATQPNKAWELLRENSAEFDVTTRTVLEGEIRLASGDVNQAEGAAQKAVASAPQSAAARYLYAAVMSRQHRTSEALEQLAAALQADPEHVPSLLLWASLRLDLGDPAGAEQAVAQAVRLEPANLEALDLYGKVLAARKQFSSAEAIAFRNMTIAPYRPEPRVLLGEIALQQGRLAAALVQFQAALVRDPQHGPAITGLVKVYGHAHVTLPMIQRMEKIAISPPASPALLQIVGRLYLQRGSPAEAQRALLRAADLRKQQEPGPIAPLQANVAGSSLGVDASGIAANNLAWQYALEGTQLDRALELARQAVDRNPRDSAMLDTLGFIHLRRREYTAAVEVLQRAAMLVPERTAERAAIMEHLGQAYAAIGLSPDPPR